VSDYRRGLRKTVATVGLPYGYTVAIWASGALVVHTHPSPPPGHLVLLPAGAYVAYLLLRLVGARASPEGVVELGASDQHLRAEAVQLAAIAVAVFGGWLAGKVGGAGAFFLAGFGVTALYLLTASAEAALGAAQTGGGTSRI
jgi:hypothetical protein